MTASQRVRANRLARKRLKANVSALLTKRLKTHPTTLTELGRLIGCTKGEVHRIMSGLRTPEVIMVARIAKLCGTTVEKILNGDGK